MSLSPDDIVGYRFKQSLRGYAIDEVDELLDRVADQVERTDAELSELRERVRLAEEQAASAERTEEALKRTLVAAQETAERVVAEAEAEATSRRDDAAGEAERIEAEARNHADQVTAAAEAAARREATAARDRVREAATRHREVLAGISRQRDALRDHLERLDAFVEAGVPAASQQEAGSAELLAGELPEAASDPDLERDGGADAGPAPEETGTPHESHVPRETTTRTADGLTVRVHDDAATRPAPLGSDARGGR